MHSITVNKQKKQYHESEYNFLVRDAVNATDLKKEEKGFIFRKIIHTVNFFSAAVRDNVKDTYQLAGAELHKEIVSNLEDGDIHHFSQGRIINSDKKSCASVAIKTVFTSAFLFSAGYLCYRYRPCFTTCAESGSVRLQSEPDLMLHSIIPYDGQNRFPGHYPESRVSLRKFTKNKRRHISIETSTPASTTVAARDIVRTEKLFDFSCIELRDNPSIEDYLRKIALTLRHPIRTLGDESQIVYTHSVAGRGCPGKAEIYLLRTLTAKIDNWVNEIIDESPYSNVKIIYRVLTEIIPILLEFMADRITSRPVTEDSVVEIDVQMNVLSTQYSNILTKLQKILLGYPGTQRLPLVAKIFDFKDGLFKIHYMGANYTLFQDENKKPYIDTDNIKTNVAFDQQNNCWVATSEEETDKSSDEHHPGIEKYSPEVILVPMPGYSVSDDDLLELVDSPLSGNYYAVFNNGFVRVKKATVNNQRIVYTTTDAGQPRLLRKGVIGWHFEPESVRVADHLAFILNRCDELKESVNLMTNVNSDGYSYNEINQKFIKYKNAYYRVKTKNGLDVLVGKVEEFYLNRNKNSFIIEKIFIPELSETLIPLQEKTFISETLLDDIVTAGVISDKGVIKHIDTNFAINRDEQYVFKVFSDYYLLAESNEDVGFFFSLRSKFSDKNHIDIYMTTNFFLKGNRRNEEIIPLTLSNICKQRRQVNEDSKCDNAYITDGLVDILQHASACPTENSVLTPDENFHSLYRDTHGHKFFFKFRDKFIQVYLQSVFESLLRFKTLVLLENVSSPYPGTRVLTKIIQTRSRSRSGSGSSILKQEIEELKYRTETRSVENSNQNAKVQDETDRAINSAGGITLYKNIELNSHWSFFSANLQCADYHDENLYGSVVKVTFHLAYNSVKNACQQFEELPPLHWRESIKAKDDNTVWLLDRDMYEYNPTSRSFFPWRNRYLEAYHYAIASDKSGYNGYVRLYSWDGNPVVAEEVGYAENDEDRTIKIQQYLEKKGGILKITLTDFPSLKKDIAVTKRERVIKFDIGIDDKSILKFSQGISILKGQPESIVVTVSKEIDLAQGPVNAPPPEFYSLSKEKKLLPGERQKK